VLKTERKVLSSSQAHQLAAIAALDNGALVVAERIPSLHNQGVSDSIYFADSMMLVSKPTYTRNGSPLPPIFPLTSEKSGSEL
jgi:hypothetical protein